MYDFSPSSLSLLLSPLLSPYPHSSKSSCLSCLIFSPIPASLCRPSPLPLLPPPLVFSSACQAFGSVSPYLFGICSMKSEDLSRRDLRWNSVNPWSDNAPDPLFPFFYFCCHLSFSAFVAVLFLQRVTNIQVLYSSTILRYRSISTVCLFMHLLHYVSERNLLFHYMHLTAVVICQISDQWSAYKYNPFQ